MEGLNKCPNPDCDQGQGSEGRLMIERDERVTREFRGWVRCDWCCVSGPVSGSEQGAKDAWNKMTFGDEDGRLSDSLGAREAIFGFIAWLTSRKEVLILSRKHVPPVDLIVEFAEANDLAECRDDYADHLAFPGDSDAEGGL